MRLRIDFWPEAELEVEEAFDWYEAQEPGLGLQYLPALDAVLLRASQQGQAYPRVARKTRRALMRRFPYVVFYVEEEDRILVTEVFHGHRNPGTWTDRVRETVAGYGAIPECVGAA